MNIFSWDKIAEDFKKIIKYGKNLEGDEENALFNLSSTNFSVGFWVPEKPDFQGPEPAITRNSRDDETEQHMLEW